MAKLTDGELIAKVETYEQNSYGIFDGTLTAERKKALDYYNGQPLGNEVEGRSQVVSRDVLDTIEAALPQLMKPFVSGDQVVQFEPKGPEDEEAAKMETAAINYYVTDKNDWFRILYTWEKDALLSKNGYAKVWWEEEDEIETESYQGLTDDQLALLMQDERIEVVEHSEMPDEMDARQRQDAIAQLSQQAQQNPQAMQQIQAIQSQPPRMLHDVKITVTERKGCIRIDNVAPEDILIGFDTRTLELCHASFVQHRAMMTADEIAGQGWELPAGAQMGTDAQGWDELNSRDIYDENAQASDFAGQYLVKDTYIRVDGELMRLIIIANQIVHNETEDLVIPFVAMTPHIMPHRHIGMSYSDLTEDIQLIKTTLLRGQLDAMYLANQPRFGISDRVNLEDMLTSRPGGVVRVNGDPGGNIMPLVTPSFPNTSFQLVEYIDSAKERRTGVTSYNQGLDANSLNKTATGVSQIMQATQQRIELVARTFAVSIKELFVLVHRLVRKYNTRADVIRINNEWATVDPREWKERKDMTISVGLGTGNKDQQLMHLQAMWQRAMAELQAGLPTITPDNMYEINKQLAINSGFRRPDQFVTDPKNTPPKEPPPDPQLQMKQMDLAADAQKFQAQTQIEEQKAKQQWQQEQLRSQNDVAIEQEKIKAQMELERWKAELDAQTTLKKTEMDLQAKIAIEQIKAANQPKAASVSVLNDTGGDFGKSIEALMAHSAQSQQDLINRSEQGQQAMVEAIVSALSRPRQIVRGADGRAIGVQ